MRPYFLNVNKSERENILDLHKTPYDGYVTRQNTSNTQPLMVQDFANDKGGITVNSNGEVSEYNNKIYMKESSGECNECGYNEMEEIALDKLEKGKSYKYNRADMEDEMEFEDEVSYPSGEKMFSFGGKKEKGHLLGKHDIEKYLNEPEELDEEPKTCSECGMYEGICECGPNMYEEIDESMNMFTSKLDLDDFISSGNRLTYDIESEDEISEPYIEDTDNEDDDIDMLMMFSDDDSVVFERKEEFSKPKINESVDKTLNMFKRMLK
jgi:hypothetical protein